MPSSNLNLLALDTSTDVISLALCRQGVEGALWQYSGAGGAQASAQLIPALQDLLALSQMDWRDLDAVVFGRGPGAFTGLRTACAVVQGLALGADLPVLPVNTLLAVAENARLQQGSTRVLAVLDARMGEVYAAAFTWSNGQWACVLDTALLAPNALLAWAAAGGITAALASDWTLAGNAWDSYGPEWTIGWGPYPTLPTARALLHLAPALLQAGHAVAADQALPFYVRDKVAQTTAERAALKPLN
jgi:tRNA threonylcarbamoyladenosine biosynthesis protein TsaB